jgi:sugar-specific transcriptional regulator TrmB
MLYMALEADLKKLGLSDKEAAVYLAALGLGPSTVLQIARKSKVARATTYLVLEALQGYGLVSEYREGDKTFFVAEDPHNLDRIIDQQEIEVKQRREKIGDLVPKLAVFMRTADDRPTVRYYEGREGLKTIRQEMTKRTKSGEEWYNLTSLDNLKKFFAEEIDYSPRKAKRIKQKTIFTTTSAMLKQKTLQESGKKLNQSKYVASDKLSSDVGLTIMEDTVAIGVFKEPVGGVMIESKEIAKLMKQWFELTWKKLS